MRFPMPRRLLLTGALLVTLPALLVACGSDDPASTAHDASHSGAHDAPAGTTASAEVATAAFVRQMIPHHEMAVVMAKAGEGRAEHAELRKLSANIVESQTAEIRELKAIAKADDIGLADVADAMSRDATSLGLDEQAMGMSMHAEDLAKADPFDRAFLDMMIPHHEGAIAMARGVLAAGATGRVRELADAIVVAQQREISEMKTWRKVWYGDAVTPTPASGATSQGHDMDGHDMSGMN